ncbi:Rv3235 family protein [Candidatus Mycobacterium wuenschmannii]|uniref:Rv3235 family protein n=1 Tax=Candidatus Mycobacterium wuenschmannii TaxID=3027808 RepID=UPI0036F412BC
MRSSNPSERSAVAVGPVVDCEPPALDVRHCRAPSPGALRKRNTHAPQRYPAPAAPMPQAVAFADAALRRVLEVIDRRRPIAHLTGLLARELVDSVLAANRMDGARHGVAVLRRVRLQPVGPAAAEVFGSYRRGERSHAIACRIEQRAGRWQVVALHIG